MRIIRNIPFWDIALFMPIIVGSTFGYLFGYLYQQRLHKQQTLYNAIEQQKLLNQILIFSNSEKSIQKILDHAIRVIISAPFSKLQSKGAIFLNDGNKHLMLKSHLHLSPELLTRCGEKGVKFGECLCGQAAAKKETIFKHCVDSEHSIQFANMADHGHYNVPIIFDGNVLGVIVVYLDVNHKKNNVEIEFLEAVANVLAIIINKYNVDRRSRENETKLKEIQQFAGIGTWKLYVESGEISASDEVFTIMGYQPQSFRYNEEEFINVTHPDDKTLVLDALEKAKQGNPFEIEARHFKKDGSIAHIVNKCNPRVLENGYVPELNGTIIDVTGIRAKEEELREKQAIVNGILKGTPDPLFLLDFNANEVTYYNKAMEDVFIQNPDFIINYPKKGASIFREYVHPDDLEQYDAMNKAIRAGQDMYTLKFRTNVFNEEFRWVEQVALVYSRDNTNRVKQVLVVSKDITDRVEAESRVKKLNRELMAKLNDIKKVNTELDQFVYSVSHDLRAPLSSVLGLVNLCKNHPEEGLMEECIERIGISIEKLDSFIKDILDYSRNARTEIQNDRFSIKAMVSELVDNIKLLSNPNIEMQVIDHEKHVFVGDRRRMSMVLNNIISNACKYADNTKSASKVTITVQTTANGCTITVEDNGIGIAKEHQPKVFDMFYRGTINSDGSGLGLYIVKEALTKMKGTTELSSNLGKGTRIKIEVPQGTRQAVFANKEA